jgi:hypothetical protein
MALLVLVAELALVFALVLAEQVLVDVLDVLDVMDVADVALVALADALDVALDVGLDAQVIVAERVKADAKVVLVVALADVAVVVKVVVADVAEVVILYAKTGATGATDVKADAHVAIVVLVHVMDHVLNVQMDAADVRHSVVRHVVRIAARHVRAAGHVIILVEVVKTAALVVVLDVLVLEVDVAVTDVLGRAHLDAVHLARHLVRVAMVVADLVPLLALDVLDVMDVAGVVVLALIRVRQHALLLASILVLGHVMEL